MGSNVSYMENTENLIETTCWCEREVVKVPAATVRAGLTDPCKREKCQTLSKQD